MRSPPPATPSESGRGSAERAAAEKTGRLFRDPCRVRSGQGRLRAGPPAGRGGSGPRPPRSRHRRSTISAACCGQQGDLAGARAAFERALAIDEASFGPDHPNVATDVNNLGTVLRDLGDLGRARAAFERALEIDERPSARTTPRWRPASTTWAGCCGTWAIWPARGRPTSGRSRSTRRSFGPDHPKVAIRRQQPGLGAAGPGRSGRRAGRPSSGRWGSTRRTFGPDHPNVAIRVNNLGRVLQDLGDLAGARAAFERALRDRRGEPRPRPPQGGHRRQQPGPRAAGPGRPGGRPGGVRAGAARSTRRPSGPTTPRSPSAVGTWAL